MKATYILILTIILALWHSFFGYLDVFIGLEIFSLLAILIYIYSNNISLYFVWISIIGCLVDLIIGRWLGINLVANLGALSLCLVLNRYFKLFQSEQKVLLIIIYSVISTIIIYILSIVSVASGEFEWQILLKRLVVNILLSLIIYSLISQNKSKGEIKV